MRYRKFHIVCLVFFIICQANVYGQNFNGGIEDGYASYSNNNIDLNAIPEYYFPTITLADGQQTLTNASTINFKVTFNLSTTNFTNDDITIGGTAVPSIAVVSGGPLEFNVAVSGMSGDGTVSISIPAGVCNETISNSINAASVNQQNQVICDITSPNVEINLATGQNDPTSISPVVFELTFSEAFTGFSNSDIVVSGTSGAITSVLSGADLVYQVEVSGMTQEGTVIINIPAGVFTDMAGNTNNISVNTKNSVEFVTNGPNVTINQAITQSDPVNLLPIYFDVVFSRDVVDFNFEDITWSGTALGIDGLISGSGSNYLIEVNTVGTEGTLIPSIQLGIVADIAGLGNKASVSTDNVVTYDITAPNVVLTSTVNASTSLSEIPFSVEFDEAVENFVALDVQVSNATLSDFIETEPGLKWDGILIPEAVGDIEIQIPDLVATDLAGNANNASNNLIFNYLGPDDTEFIANNIFTPNADLYNRFWLIQNVEKYVDYELIIRNANGQIVYQVKNYQNNWDGKYNNKPLPTGTYYFLFMSPDKSRIYKGFINILYQ